VFAFGIGIRLNEVAGSGNAWVVGVALGIPRDGVAVSLPRRPCWGALRAGSERRLFQTDGIDAEAIRFGEVVDDCSELPTFWESSVPAKVKNKAAVIVRCVKHLGTMVILMNRD
jgi:hypothetical protein